MCGLADVAGAGFADPDGGSFGFVDVSAEKVFGLVLLDEIADRGGAGMEARPDAVETRAVRRGMADEDQGRQFSKALEAFGELGLGVFAGCMERRGAGVTEPGDVPAAHLHVTLVEIVETVARAHTRDLGCRFVVAGKHVHLVTARLKNLAATVEAFRPRGLVAGRDVKIGIHAEQAFERLPIVMDVGKNEQLQESRVAEVAYALACARPGDARCLPLRYRGLRY